MRIIRKEEKKKKAVYIMGGIVSVIILFFWITLPLMHKSSWDTSVTNPYGMSKKSADLALLDSGGIDAPGSPLTGALIDNPATTLDLEASSLFKMPDIEIKYEEEKTEENTSSFSADANPSVPSVYKGEGQISPGGAKLTKLPSLGGSSGGSMTVGSTHNRFFGTERGEAKLTPLNTTSDEIKSKKGNLALAALKAAEKGSIMAESAKKAEESRGNASQAFEKSAKVDEYLLNSKEEKESAESGIALAKAEADFKKSDPSLSKKKIALPKPEKDEDETKKMEEEIKMMILKMIIQATIGSVFGAMGQAISASILGTQPTSSGR